MVELAGRGDLVRAEKECLKRLVAETGGESNPTSSKKQRSGVAPASNSKERGE
jgi:hypothetical protein